LLPLFLFWHRLCFSWPLWVLGPSSLSLSCFPCLFLLSFFQSLGFVSCSVFLFAHCFCASCSGTY
jgi:hypothetical protein